MKNIISLFLLLPILFASTITYAANKKILLVVTNHEQLGTTGKKTGYYLPEVAHPYFKFIKAGHKVVFASPKGGRAPMDPKSKDLKDLENKKFYENEELMKQLDNTVSLNDVKAKDYDAIVFAGGHGTMWDFNNSETLNKLTASIYENGGVVAAVCHGPAALINVKLSNGNYLLKGKSVTGFTNVEEDIVQLSAQMPFMLETEMIKRGANFSSAEAWKEKVVVDGRLVTGQNPASAGELGSQIVKILK